MSDKLSKVIYALLCLSVVWSCSPRSYVMSFEQSRRVGASGRFGAVSPLGARGVAPDEVTSPDKNPDTSVGIQSEDWSAAKQDEIPYAQGAINTYDHNFSSGEIAHVKFSSYEPFSADSDSFVIDLDQQRGGFTYPIDGKYSSAYGRRGRGVHSGVDLVAPAKTPIFATFDGTVRMSKPYSNYGNVVVIRHDNGLETVYAHASKNLVGVGQKVKSGDTIALCGRTGRATTDHLHFEVRIKGQTINPQLLIDPVGKSLQGGKLLIGRSGSGSVTAKLNNGKQTDTPKSEQQNVILADARVVAEASAPITPSIQSKGIRIGDQVYDAPVAMASAQSDQSQYHKIVSGDTLSTIARKYSTSVGALCQLNNITKDSIIRTGKKLRVK